MLRLPIVNCIQHTTAINLYIFVVYILQFRDSPSISVLEEMCALYTTIEALFCDSCYALWVWSFLSLWHELNEPFRSGTTQMFTLQTNVKTFNCLRRSSVVAESILDVPQRIFTESNRCNMITLIYSNFKSSDKQFHGLVNDKALCIFHS